MSLFRKKKKEPSHEDFMLPEPPPEFSNPPAQQLPELSELPELPPAQEQEQEHEIKREFSNGGTTISRKDFQKTSRHDAFSEIPAPHATINKDMLQRRVMGRDKPIFVKLDKFKDSVEHLTEIKAKLKNAGMLLKKLKDIRQKEDHELSEWEDDLETLKLKLEEIDKKLFSDIE